METISFPFLPSISPCVMYLRRFCLIFPRTISRKRRWSWSIRKLIGPCASSRQSTVDSPQSADREDGSVLKLSTVNCRLSTFPSSVRSHLVGVVHDQVYAVCRVLAKELDVARIPFGIA